MPKSTKKRRLKYRRADDKPTVTPTPPGDVAARVGTYRNGVVVPCSVHELVLDLRDQAGVRGESDALMLSVAADALVALQAHVRKLAQERDHESREKETVADVAKANHDYHRRKRTDTEAHVSSLRAQVEAAIEAHVAMGQKEPLLADVLALFDAPSGNGQESL